MWEGPLSPDWWQHVRPPLQESASLPVTGCPFGYYETLIKTARQFTYVAIYIEDNPAKKSLVTTPEEWEESSASRKDLITDPWPRVFDS